MYNDIISRHGFKGYLGVLPGWDWLSDHEHDLDGWQPTFYISDGHVSHTMTIKKHEIIKEIIKANK